MKKFSSFSLLLALIPLQFLLTGPAAAANPDVTPICIALKQAGLGAPSVTLTLSAVPYGPFVHLAGQGRFSQAIAPPGSLVIYSVTGTAIQNADGWWISLEGTGYDLAQIIFRGTFGIQFNTGNTSPHTLSYTKQSLDGSSSSTLTGVAEIRACP